LCKRNHDETLYFSKNYNPRAVLHTISEAKNELISATEYPQFARGYFQEAVAQIYLAYQKMLHENRALDFDDLLIKTVELFKKQKEILGKYQEKYQFILVDEYQEPITQYTITKFGWYRHLCCWRCFSAFSLEGWTLEISQISKKIIRKPKNTIWNRITEVLKES
jgi:hypothetical protein